MTSAGEKDVLQKIVEGMDISDDELEFHDGSSAHITSSDVQSDEFDLTDKEKTAEDNIVSEIFDPSPDTVSTRTTRNKKVSETEKNNEEETIENIQTLLNTNESDMSVEVKPEFNEEDEHAGVFISVNPEEGNGLFLEEEESTEQIQNPIEIPQEIPQVMLDQLDLKKFPNLKINDNIESSTPQKAQSVKKTPPQANSKLLQEIQKRMENRKCLQNKSTVVPLKITPVVEIPESTPSRGRGRPKKGGLPVKSTPTSVAVETKSKPILSKAVKPTPPSATVETKSKPIIRPKNVNELKADPKPAHIKKTPMRPTPRKVEKKVSTDIEDILDDEEEEEEVPLMSRPRSSRKIKLTDKFKTFVAQEKTIKSILSEEENKPVEKKSSGEHKKPTATPTAPPKPRPEIQLKRKKEETSEEENEEESSNERRGGRSLRNRKQLKKAASPVKTTPAPASVKKTPAPAPTPKAQESETPRPRGRKKELISESELSDGYDVVDDEDRDPDFHDSDLGSDVSALSDWEHDTSVEPQKSSRTVMELVRDVFHVMPTWNLHILPNTNTFCLAQVIRGVNGIPMLKKCIEIDLDFRVKVYVHQIHYKKYDGIYDSEDHLIELLQLVDAM